MKSNGLTTEKNIIEQSLAICSLAKPWNLDHLAN
jgi:hypothetical protein